MDGINLLFLILIYILGGLLLLGVILVFIALGNKDKNKVRQGIKALSIPFGLSLIYLVYQFFTNASLVKPTTTELIGTYAVSNAVNLNLDEHDYGECKLIIDSDTTYTFLAPSLGNVKEAGKFKLNYDKPYHELTFFSDKGMRNGHIDRHANGFSIRVDISGEDSRQSLYFNKIKQ